jgi:hypothetical protein
MFYYEWLGEPGEEALIPNMHECPPPFPREVAEAYVQMARAMGGMVVSQRMKAQIRLGLAA